jgi:hypothetical protein
VALFDRFEVIDVDTHITEPPDTWTSRVSRRWGDDIPHIERVEQRHVAPKLSCSLGVVNHLYYWLSSSFDGRTVSDPTNESTSSIGTTSSPTWFDLLGPLCRHGAGPRAPHRVGGPHRFRAPAPWPPRTSSGLTSWHSFERKTPTPDAPAEAITEVLERADALVEIVTPGRRETFPITRGGGAAVGQLIERRLDPAQGDADALRGPDEGHPAERITGVPALVPLGSAAGDQALRLVEVQGGNGDTTSLRHLAHGELAGCDRFLGHPLDLKLT